MNLAKNQKRAMLKDLRDVNRILKIGHENESKVMFQRVGQKEDLCVIGVCDASYHHDDNLVGGEMIMLGNKKTEDVSPIYWKSGSRNKGSDEIS